MIILEDVHFSYPAGTVALNSVSLEIPAGSFLALMGANGSGKSTLLKHINGLLEPKAGRVSVGGIAVGKNSFDEISGIVGFVFQDPNDQIFAPTVLDDICYGPRNQGLGEEEACSRARLAAAQVGISNLLERPIHHLSYGQKKRLSIAGVLAMEPRVLVLDEPTASLDPGGEERLMRILIGLHRQGMTIVMATHDVDLVPLYANTACLLDRGAVAARGPLREVFSDAGLIRRCHLRLPRISSLFDMIPGIGELPLTVGMARRQLEELLESRAPAPMPDRTQETFHA